MNLPQSLFRRAFDGMIAARQREAQRVLDRYFDGYPEQGERRTHGPK